MHEPSQTLRNPRGWNFHQAALIAAIIATGCAESPVSARQQAPATAPDSVVATVDEAQVTLAEVDAKALELDATEFRGMSLGQALFEARQMTLDELVSERLLEAEAKRQGTSRDDYVAREATGKLAEVTNGEVEKWYQDNATRVGGQPLESVREPIRNLLSQVRRREAIDNLVAKLKSSAKITTRLEPPRTEVVIAANDPAVGPQQAAVEIIEFSDFQ